VVVVDYSRAILFRSAKPDLSTTRERLTSSLDNIIIHKTKPPDETGSVIARDKGA